MGWRNLWRNGEYVIDMRAICPMVIPDVVQWMTNSEEPWASLRLAAFICCLVTWPLFFCQLRLMSRDLERYSWLLITLPTVASLNAIALAVPTSHMAVQMFSFMWSALQLSRCLRRIRRDLIQCRQDFFDESSLTVGFSFGLKLRIDSFSMRVLLVVAEQVAMVRSVLLLLDAVLEGEGAQTPISLMLVNTVSTISAMIALSLMRKLVSSEISRVILVTQFLVFVLAMEYSIFEFLGRQALIPCTPALPEVTSSRFIYRMLLMYELSAISFVITGGLLIRNRHYSVSSAPDRTMLTAET